MPFESSAAGATTLERFRAGYGRALEFLVIGLMVVLAAEVTVGVAFRTAGHALAWYDEVASILLAWLTFYGSALASCRRAHISCPEVVQQLAPRPRHAVAVLAQLLVIGFFALLGYIGASVLPVLATDTLVTLPSVPVSVVQSVIPISAALILVAEVITLVELLRAGPRAGGSALADALH